MRVAFVQDLWLEWQAPMLLAAVARARGDDCMMVIDGDPGRAARKALQWRPDVVAWSVLTGSQRFALECARLVKRLAPTAVTVIGGPHVILCPDVAADPAVDFACIGEGEPAFAGLLNRLDRGGSLGNVPGLVWQDGTELVMNRVGAPVDLDSLPRPDRSLYYRHHWLRRQRTRVFYGSRGCDGDCTYCCGPALRRAAGADGIRHRDPGLVCAEIRAVHGEWGVSTVFFQDDTFGVDWSWTEDLLNRYRVEVGLPFMCMTRANLLSPAMVRLLARAGCVSVMFGIEHGDCRTRERLLNRDESDEVLIRANRLLSAAGIRTSTLCMIGVPGETMASARMTLELSRRVGADYQWAVPYRPFPGTELEGKARARGELGDSVSRDSSQGTYYLSLMLKLPDRVQLQNLQRLFTLAVRWPAVAGDRVLNQRWLSGTYFLIFAWQSLVRELRLWRRSLLSFVMTSILNQLTFYRLRRSGTSGDERGDRQCCGDS